MNAEEQERKLTKRKKDQEKLEYLKKKGYNVVEIWECEFREWLQEDQVMRNHLYKIFPYRHQMSEKTLLSKILGGELFGYARLDIAIPENKRHEFANFPPIFKNAFVGRDDIGDYMKDYAEKHGHLKKPRKMLISSTFLEKGLMITPYIKFLVGKGAVVSKIYQFVEYTPQKCFDSFVQNIVEARREGDLNPQSSVKAETQKLIGNSSYGRQIMDRSKHTTTRYANESTVDSFINNKLFNSFSEIVDGVYEVTSAKPTIKHEEPIALGFFILQYAKLRMLELYYNFFVEYCDVNLYMEMEMDTGSLYLALGKETIEECIRPEMKAEWDAIRAWDCDDDFKADAFYNFFPRTCCAKHIQHDKREPGLFKEEYRCTEMIALCSKTYMCYNDKTGDTKISCKGLNKNFLEEPAAKYRKVMNDKECISSTNRGFRSINNAIQTYTTQRKGLNFFYPKRKVLPDGVHTIPLDI